MSSSCRLGQVNRRTFAKGGVLFTAAALGLRTGSSGEAQASQPRSTGAATGRQVTIIAHPDDDLIFINPDIQQSLAAGAPTQTICITASEAVPSPSSLTREQYAADQQTAARAAYAGFAGAPDAWTRTKAIVAGKAVEIASLNANPEVRLVYLFLPDAFDFRLEELHQNALRKLSEDRNGSYRVPTFVVPGSPVDQEQTYDRGELVAVLAELLEKFLPTTVRLQDPYPDPRYWDDHEDHIHGARLAQDAVNSYVGPAEGRFAVVPRYRCYNTGGFPYGEAFPVNVPPGPLAVKWAGYQIFKDHDPITGDFFDPQVSRNYQRWPVSAPWAIRDGNGTLHAFAAVANHVVAWRNDGSAWTGPTRIADGAFAPGVAVATDGDGRVVLAVLDLVSQDILTTRQTSPGGGFGTWENLGNPDGVFVEFTATPCLVRNPAGGMELLVRNASGGLSNKYQDKAGDPWSAGWSPVAANHPRADETQDAPVGFLAANGRIDVFSLGYLSMLHWSQPAGASFAFDGSFADAGIENTGGPALAAHQDGRVAAFVREAGDGAIGMIVSDANGNWSRSIIHLGGDQEGGIGAPTAATAQDSRIVVFKRNDDRTISYLRQTTVNRNSFGTWSNLGGDVEVGPTVLLDKNGFLRLLAIFGDGRLYERKQSATGVNGAFAAWQPAGS